MEYYTFIRPDELSNIRLGDIKIKEQKVFVSSTISKNRRDGMVGLNDSLVKLMIELDIFRNSSDYFLFGKDFKPSIQKQTHAFSESTSTKYELFCDTRKLSVLQSKGLRHP